MNPLFAYLYDARLADRRFERDLAALENALAQRGISGRVARLAIFRQPRELIEDLIKAGVKNIVFVGQDQTLQENMWFLPELDATIGFIPLTAPSAIAKSLGIPVGIEAVNVLAARLVEVLSVGRIEDRYFLSEAVLPHATASFEVEGNYRLQFGDQGAIAIRNLDRHLDLAVGRQDLAGGWLEAVIQARCDQAGLFKRKKVTETCLPFRQGKIISDQTIEIFVDGYVLRGRQFKVSFADKKLKMIIGRRQALSSGDHA